MSGDDRKGGESRGRTGRVLPLVIYILTGLVIGFAASIGYLNASMAVGKHVIVNVTEEGIRLGYLNGMIGRIWLSGALLFLGGVVLVGFKRKWIFVVALLVMQVAAAVIMSYYDAEMIEVVEGIIK
ncbi:hypothetical protein GCM10009785_32240 [Brooklawnia cerclae]|uniref:DUF4064 domain-containing protein n=1 Tax=Brooklawnia cerclae TaxID=349934 RepID=A0ABX0SEP0_9ACTN|nr:hypothetical protein [Brooklawnia cerclae]NIH56485.1 hypothetical protein [Brooklawnia cerclae]